MVLSGICENRTPLTGVPSTCLVDTLIVPLPSFLLLLTLAGLLVLSKLRPAFPSVLSRLPGTSRYPKWLYILHTVLVLAGIIMSILEFTRLILVQQGVGLLPVNTAALICVFVLMSWRGRQRNIVLSSCFDAYWLLALAFEALKVARLNLLNNEHPSKNKNYPTSDWLLDNAVILGLYVVFFILESAYLALAVKQKRGSSLDSAWQESLKTDTVPYKHDIATTP